MRFADSKDAPVSFHLLPLIKQLTGETAASDAWGLEYEEVDGIEDIVRYRITHDGHSLLQLECTGDTMTLRWETEMSFGEFCESLTQLTESSACPDGQLTVAMRHHGKTGLSTTTVRSASGIKKAIVKLAGKHKPTLLLVEAGTYLVWFEPHESFDLTSRLGDHQLLGANIAIQIKPETDLDLAAQFFQATSCNWMDWEAIRDVLKKINASNDVPR